ncbi:MAG TPA: HD domain-containing protein [Polyangia bacterium]
MSKESNPAWFVEALVYAAQAHGATTRKGTTLPYVLHPIEVAATLLRHGASRELVTAGLLHDVVEDTGTSVDEIRAHFGGEVAALVAAVTEQKLNAQGEERDWRVRKDEQLAHLAQAPRDVALLKAADTLANARAIVGDWKQVGDVVWERFNAGKERQAWYYTQVFEVARMRLGAHALVKELRLAIAELTNAAM